MAGIEDSAMGKRTQSCHSVQEMKTFFCDPGTEDFLTSRV